ncbi:glycine--tRNA ligase subunit beta [Sphingobium yanoikuyae]|uniref:Glycine--tRNA ligase beta subunit n=1 Tax=Sphingobium yanoikuyae TaxID=13690 RepID=A0A9X7UAC7_SPHYA|nr:glycine--tRNA ligase subunit beta [Sphingobium yanoikuyae]QNG45659.1 glycine--tRNA ligase subunit beta [Sphingobium yanoikuyae]
MTDFLLELRCEEIPARMQLKASDDLARLFTEELAKAGLKPASIDSFVTPRRLALIARDLPLETAAVSEEFKGPRTSAPAQALEGFLRKTGLTQDQLEDRDGVWFAVVNKPGRATTDVLAEAVPAVIRAFPWPKSMRWGAASATTESLRWVRPLQGIIALLGGEIVPLSIEGIEAGRETVGHRFHSTGAIRIDGADDYADKLRAAYVIVSHQERQAIIEAKAGEAAAAKGYSVIEDKGLVAENAGLTEWPVPLLGDFDPEFLEVPPEVIQLTLRINQKYFVLRDAAGKLAPAFICTANIEAKDGGVAIVAGNRKVLAARLSDARFFWQQDRKTPLAEQAQKLGRITFHEKLGTVADKVERVAKLAEWLASEGIVPNCDPALARQAAELCKADLVTEMVGEFPELQGVMGGYYARAEGLPDAVADAIRDHYKPVGQGDDVPTAPVTVAVSLADKLDTIAAFGLIDEWPTGSRDPFALRRAALASARIIESGRLRLSFKAFIGQFAINVLERMAEINTPIVEEARLHALDLAGLSVGAEAALKQGFSAQPMLDALASADQSAPPKFRELSEAISADPQLVDITGRFLDFFADRLKVQQKEAGVRHDLIDAVFALGGEDDLVRLLARVKALQSFVATDDGANLLAGYKRAANILKKEGVEQAEAISLSYEPEKAEADLIAALDAAEPQAAQAVAAEEFEGAMAALATLRAPIDAFFEAVTVNDADPAKRTTRLALLARVRDAVHNVADFSKITG